MERVFSGIQPTGAIHVGNYLGAVRNWVRMQSRADCTFCIVDLHAITTPYEPGEMQPRIAELAVDLIASGVDPERCTLFVQSMVPEHTELCWLFASIASHGALERMTQFKDKSEQYRDAISAGLFAYPVLQAADILLYKANKVPVGDDQLQHLELSREIARRFNHRFGDTFPEPEAELTAAARVMALNEPTRKMSKSIPGSTITFAESDAEIRKKIARAVTDAGPGEAMSPGVANLFTLLEAFAPATEVDRFKLAYEEGALRYGELKPAVAEAMIAEISPIRARREELLRRPEAIWEALDHGAEKARRVAQRTMSEVRERMGLRRTAA